MALPVYPGPGNTMPPSGQTPGSGATAISAAATLIAIGTNATRNLIELEALALAEQSINAGGSGRDFQFNSRGLGIGRGAVR